MNMGVLAFLSLVVYVASSKKRIEFFSKTVSRVLNGLVRFITFGHKKNIVRYDKVSAYFADIHESVKIAKKNKKLLQAPISSAETVFWSIGHVGEIGEAGDLLEVGHTHHLPAGNILSLEGICV